MKAHPLSNFERGTVFHLIDHYFDSPVTPNIKLYLDENKPDEGDEQLVKRLINVYGQLIHLESKLPSEQLMNQGVWQAIKHTHHAELDKCLFDNNIAQATRIFNNCLRRKESFGLGASDLVFNALSSRRGPSREDVILLFIDRLVSLAEAVGVLNVENPEQGDYGRNIQFKLEALVAAIQGIIECEFFRPKICGNFGVEIGGNLYDFRSLEDAHSMWRCRSLMKSHKLSTFCEIGAGYGGLALHFQRYNMGKYFCFDLPLVNIIQGYFLMKVFGPDKVKFYTEDIPDRAINIMPYWSFFENRKFDLALNRNFLSEIPINHTQRFVEKLETDRSFLMSISQESKAPSAQEGIDQVCVREVAGNFPNFRPINRNKSWMRKGYVEELYSSAL